MSQSALVRSSMLMVFALLLLPACDGAGIVGGVPQVSDGASVVNDPTPPGSKADGGAPAKNGCSPKCNASQRCSKAGYCIPKGNCAHNADCPVQHVCNKTTGKCQMQGKCGSQKVAVDMVPPNLLLVLDRSCSMNFFLGVKKWPVAVNAISKLVTNYKGKIRFGMILFPDVTGHKCTQDNITVPVKPGQEDKIKTMLNGALIKGHYLYPNGPCVTNIDTAVQQASMAAALKDTSRQSYVLLITDGKQALCSAAGGDKGTTQLITQMKQKGISTFVLGFGAGVDPNQLNIFANAGGVPASGSFYKYFKAGDQVSLDQALAQIAAKTFGCVVSLKKVPGNMHGVHVFLDNKQVSKDTSHKSGWDYDAANNLLTFYGQTCQDLRTNKTKAVDIVLTCKQPGVDAGVPDAGGNPQCPAGTTSCTASSQCQAKMKCFSGCCTKIIQ